MLTKIALLSVFSGLVAGWAAPTYSGYTLKWQDSFAGASGTSPNANNWNLLNKLDNDNDELENYTPSNQNIQISGGNTVQIVPWRGGTKGWTSGRMESKYTFTPAASKITFVEADIRFGTDAHKKGIWPAFWMLGDSFRHGTGWPACGEVDAFEMVDGVLTGYGTVHCDKAPGGICNEYNGIGESIAMPDLGWHTWRVMFDRRPGTNWQAESITWFMDNKQFHQVTGARIGNQAVWQSLAEKPLFFILNVAVGGDWPGAPDSTTVDGFGNMMEVGYVAHYEAN